MTPDKVSTLLLFGATGDLSHRMLLPSLYGLHADGLLPGTSGSSARRAASWTTSSIGRARSRR